MAHWVKHFGEKLIDNSGKEYNTATELDGKYVLIYFSAHWCPPCRQFTPMLAKAYQTFKSKNIGPFEIIFNSWDKSEDQFNEYFATMPWKTFPSSFSSNFRKNLDKLYKVSGIPTLIVLDKNGDIITKEGRGAIMKDPNGTEFPWFPKKVHELIGDTLINKSKEEVQITETLKGKTYGILFGGKWIGQKFATFVSHFSEIRPKILASGKEFPVIFASLDKTPKDYNESLSILPDDILTFEFKDPRVDELAEGLGINEIPNFTVVDGEGSISNSNAYAAINLDKTGEYFPWGPRAVEPIDLASNSDLNTAICAVGFLDESSPSFAKFKEVGEAYYAAFKRGEKEEVKFYFTGSKEGVSKRLRDVFKVGDQPTILYLNLPKFYTSTDFDSFEDTLNKVVNGSFDQMSSL